MSIKITIVSNAQIVCSISNNPAPVVVPAGIEHEFEIGSNNVLSVMECDPSPVENVIDEESPQLDDEA